MLMLPVVPALTVPERTILPVLRLSIVTVLFAVIVLPAAWVKSPGPPFAIASDTPLSPSMLPIIDRLLPAVTLTVPVPSAAVTSASVIAPVAVALKAPPLEFSVVPVRCVIVAVSPRPPRVRPVA